MSDKLCRCFCRWNQVAVTQIRTCVLNIFLSFLAGFFHKQIPRVQADKSKCIKVFFPSGSFQVTYNSSSLTTMPLQSRSEYRTLEIQKHPKTVLIFRFLNYMFCDQEVVGVQFMANLWILVWFLRNSTTVLRCANVFMVMW